jgi:hypothetical protein
VSLSRIITLFHKRIISRLLRPLSLSVSIFLSSLISVYFKSLLSFGVSRVTLHDTVLSLKLKCLFCGTYKCIN